MADGTRTAAHRIRKFDQEHTVVHRATEGVKQVWRGLKEVRRRSCTEREDSGRKITFVGIRRGFEVKKIAGSGGEERGGERVKDQDAAR